MQNVFKIEKLIKKKFPNWDLKTSIEVSNGQSVGFYFFLTSPDTDELTYQQISKMKLAKYIEFYKDEPEGTNHYTAVIKLIKKEPKNDKKSNL